MSHEYRQHLIVGVKELIFLQQQLFSIVLNLLMSGEFQDINSVFETGDTFEFSLEHLKISEDTNVKHLVRTIETIRQTADSLILINNLSEKELGDY